MLQSKFTSHKDLKPYLWELLGLDKRSIIFHVIDADDDRLYYRPDMITTADDLYDSDGLFDIGTAFCEERELHITSVESYLMGDGESDHADYSDIEALEEIAETSPDALNGVLELYADLLCAVRDFTVQNPAYDDWSDDDSSEDDLDEGGYYIRSVSRGDFGPSDPWNAPGMSVSDFIR